jgi:hypothetical protein
MTTFTSEDRESAELPITALSKEIREAFIRQFPDLYNNHIAFMCFREGWQRGAEAAYAEAYHLDEWEWK